MSAEVRTSSAKKKRKSTERSENQVENKKGKVEKDASLSWDEEADNKLIGLIEEDISRKGRPKLIFVRHIDWKRIADKLKDESGYVCDPALLRSRWEEVTKKVRKLRTVPELMDDVKRALKYHVALIPKMPLGAYQLFCMAKRPRLKEKYPDMAFSELSKRLGKKWRELEQEKKQKYIKRAKERKLEYDQRLKEWQLENPGGVKELNGEISMKMPMKPDEVTPFSVFCTKKSKEIEDKHPGLDEEVLQSKLSKKWEKLKEHKKEKYVKMAEESNAEQRKLAEEHKNDSKEKKSKTVSAYRLFVDNKRRELLAANPNLGFGEVSSICAKHWKEIDPKERSELEEKAKLLKEARPKPEKEKARKKPPKAYQIYFKETRLQLLAENPKLEFGEIATLCASKWKSLAKEEVEVYKCKEKEMMEEFQAETKDHERSITREE